MTIFEEYLNGKREEKSLMTNYLWQFYNYKDNVIDMRQAKNNLQKCQNSLNQYDEVQEKRKNIGKNICELSFLRDGEAKRILPKIMKDTTYEDYEFKSLIIDGLRRVFLIKRGTSLDFNLTMDDLLTNENVIFLASTSYSNGFNLYQTIDDNNEICSELNANLYNSEFIILRNFVDGYISAKAEREGLNLGDYYYLVCDTIEHGYDEGLLEYYDLDDGYVEFDRKAAREAKRKRDDYYHKQQRDGKNRVIAQRKLAKLPSKYMPVENVENLTFIRRLELMLGRKFSSMEKDTIKGWLVFGFDEDIIVEAYKEASIRGNYNTSAIAKILSDLMTFDIKENTEKNILLAKEFRKQ